MKLVQLLPALDEGGVERGTVELSRELVKQGVANTVISIGGRLVEQLTGQGSDHVQFDVKSKNLLTVPWRVAGLYRLLKTIDPDVIHVRSRVPAWLAWLANKKLRKPLVTTVHGFNSVNAYSRVMTYGDRVICGSQFMIDHVMHHYQVPREKLVLIPRGLDEAVFSEQLDEDFITTFGQANGLADKFVICQVGRLTHWKDQATSIRAFAKVREQMPHARLLLVGSYEDRREGYYRELRKLAEQSGHASDILFTGNQRKIREILSLSDVCVSASNKPETFGRANIEALFMNRPLLATRLGATLDYVFEGENGFFFEPGNDEQLASLILKSVDYAFSGSRMRPFVLAHYTLADMLEQNLAVYRELLGQ